jgi:hypothetical protein
MQPNITPRNRLRAFSLRHADSQENVAGQKRRIVALIGSTGHTNVSAIPSYDSFAVPLLI